MTTRSYVFSCLLLSLAIAGCAGASSQSVSQSAPVVNQPPSQIVVYHFAVDTADVTLNQGLIQKSYRAMTDADENTDEHNLALAAAEDICLEVVTQLQKKGLNAICLKRGTPTQGNNVLIVDGEFIDVSEGNKLSRMVIGLGVGKSQINSNVDIYHRTVMADQQVMEFDTHADSGAMPGAAIMGAPGMAAGGGAAIASAGINVVSAGVKSHRSSLGFLTDKSANEIVERIMEYYAQQGWAAGS
ncbi:MAG TPA: DUF4410 domain-containing protein [Candidatus Binataceae bacterium]|nr:DUF4410 domain-containing protein [Candidatus Binataceae bacterium]